VEAIYDFAAYAPDGHLALVVDAKARSGTDTNWAREVRQNLLAGANVANDAMFLLATPEAIYLWRRGEPADALATYELLADDIFRPYFERAGIDLKARLDPFVFEMIVASWLSDRTRGDGPSHDLLETAGLSDALRGGHVVHQDAA
jgi:hypothetical protein